MSMTPPAARAILVGTWVYIESEPGLWTVGYYGPDEAWFPDSDYGSREEAAARVHYLNGGRA